MQLIIETEFSILQLVLIIYTIRNFQYKSNKNRIIKDVLNFMLFIVLITIIPDIFKIKILSLVVIHSIMLMLLVIIHKEAKMNNLALFSINYFIVCSIGILFRNRFILSRIFSNTRITSSSELYYIIMQILIITLLLSINVIREKAENLINYIEAKPITIGAIVVCDYIIDFVVSWDYERSTYWLLIIEILIIAVSSIIVFAAVNYFVDIQLNSSNIDELNKMLENKNDQLRKIKHDYGAQISYLYGLHLLKRYDDLEKALEEICENNKLIDSAVAVKNVENSIIYDALEPALKEGIHVILNEDVKIDKLNINKEELINVITQIRFLLVRDMNGEGIIFAKVYESLGNIIIKIENHELNKKNKHTFEGGVLDKVSRLFKSRNKDKELILLEKFVEYLNGKLYIRKNKDKTKVTVIIQEE